MLVNLKDSHSPEHCGLGVAQLQSDGIAAGHVALGDGAGTSISLIDVGSVAGAWNCAATEASNDIRRVVGIMSQSRVTARLADATKHIFYIK